MSPESLFRPQSYKCKSICSYDYANLTPISKFLSRGSRKVRKPQKHVTLPARRKQNGSRTEAKRKQTQIAEGILGTGQNVTKQGFP